MFLPWLLCVVLFCAVLFLTVKVIVMQKSMIEICKRVEEHLSNDTNQLISVSSGDRYVRRLARELNVHLRALRKMHQRYETGDRELKEAVTNISHDLRTPLTAICGYLELLEKEEKSENTRRYLAQIANRTEAMKELTEELFRYSVISSISELSYEQVNLCRVLEDTLVSFYGAFQQKKIAPEIDLPTQPVYRHLDPSALSRIFGNIIGNAIKYSEGDLRVSITKEGTMCFSNHASALSLVDVGKLFDRFYTVDSARNSTGLGLSIAKLLTERMGGDIRAEYREQCLFIMILFQSQ